MVHNNKEVLEYWNKNEVESMYDKNLINLEIELIKNHIKPGAKILDAGCGEGEGTLVYTSIPDANVHAVDFSDTRLEKAKNTLSERTNVQLKKVDFLGEYELDNDYDYVISQRFLINLMEWELQQKVILDLTKMLKPSGSLIMCEGSVDGVDELNKFRALFGLEPINVKWHNLFFNDQKLIDYMAELGFELTVADGLGDYLLLTRGVRPTLDKELNWEHNFNNNSAKIEVRDLLGFKDRFSRIKIWKFTKKNQ